jgi:F-type H+-transporting ATPase subunit a
MHVSLAPEALFNVGPITVTNSMLTAVITTLLIGGGLVWAAHQLKVKPAGGFAGIYEALADMVLGQAEQVLGSREKALQYFPFLATLFLFILGNNLLAQIPGFNVLTLNGEPVLRSVTADLNATTALALISVILTQIYAIRALGVVGNLKRYFHGNAMMKGVGVLEIFLEFTRVISFSFRLFGNIFAGEVLLIVISTLLPVLGPVPFWGLELFVAFIQAYVFTMLTMIFIGIGTTPIQEHGAEAH